MTYPLSIEPVAHPDSVAAGSRPDRPLSPAVGPEAFRNAWLTAIDDIFGAFASGLGNDWTLERIHADCRKVEVEHG